MNRHERRRARAIGDSNGNADAEGYDRTAEAGLQFMRAFCAKSPDPPRFALVDDSLAIAASMLDHGHAFARNEAAHVLVEVWRRMTRELGLRDGPTYMMLRAYVELLELPHDIATIDELFPGAELRSISGAPAGKA